MNRPSSLYRSLQTWVSDIRPRGGIPAVADEIRQRGLGRARLGNSLGSLGQLRDGDLRAAGLLAGRGRTDRGTRLDARGRYPFAEGLPLEP